MLFTTFFTECFCDSRKQECDAWNGLIEKTRSESRVNLNCQRNPNCTGIDCDGLYSYQVRHVDMLYMDSILKI